MAIESLAIETAVYRGLAGYSSGYKTAVLAEDSWS